MYLVEWKRMFLKLEITLCLVFHRYVMYFFFIKLHYIIIYFTYVKMLFFSENKTIELYLVTNILCFKIFVFDRNKKSKFLSQP